MMLTLPMPVTLMVTVTESLMVSTVVATMVPKMDTTALPGTMVPGASLRDRATLSSPLRGLAPSLPAVAARRALVPAPLRTLPPGSPASIPPSLMPLVAGSPTAGAV